jgi:hypothetical protein
MFWQERFRRNADSSLVRASNDPDIMICFQKPMKRISEVQNDFIIEMKKPATIVIASFLFGSECS